jgi:hypothetical protein
LLAVDFHEDFVNIERIAVTLVFSLQPAGVPGAKLNAPQADGFIAYFDSTFGQEVFDISMAQIESMVQPNSVLNNFGWKSMAFV